MGIAIKDKRKLNIGNRDYFWRISEDYDSADVILRVASQDKKFVVNYHLGQPNNTRHLIVLGKKFNKPANAGKTPMRVLCPRWEEDDVIKPLSIQRLVEWCFEEKADLIQVDWTGKTIITG